jgi:hypothetical protein
MIQTACTFVRVFCINVRMHILLLQDMHAIEMYTGESVSHETGAEPRVVPPHCGLMCCRTVLY